MCALGISKNYVFWDGLIMDFLNYTWDSPSSHGEHKGMPVLDCEMWIGKEGRVKGIPEEAVVNSDLITVKNDDLKKVIL